MEKPDQASDLPWLDDAFQHIGLKTLCELQLGGEVTLVQIKPRTDEIAFFADPKEPGKNPVAFVMPLKKYLEWRGNSNERSSSTPEEGQGRPDQQGSGAAPPAKAEEKRVIRQRPKKNVRTK